MTKSMAKARSRRASSQRTFWLIILAVFGLAVLVFAIAQAAHPGGVPVDPTQVAALADGKALGPKTAGVVVQEFADFQCPICGEFQKTIEPQLINQYVKTGQIRFEYHHFIVIDGNVGGSESRQAAIASECANAQGQFWTFHDLVFSHQVGEGSGAFNDANLAGFAKTLGLDTGAFDKCFSAKQYALVVKADESLGLSKGVHGTPSVFINGVQVDNPFDYASFQRQIDAALAQAG